ncbi:MAG: exodeoxyribonuclease VII small subunit [Steroidobacteraceae bacterium]
MPQNKVESKVPEFEQALAELETLVERLERGDLPLDEALKTFERGVELTRHCQGALKAAQQRVEILLKRNGQPESEPYTAPESQPESQELAAPPTRG